MSSQLQLSPFLPIVSIESIEIESIVFEIESVEIECIVFEIESVETEHIVICVNWAKLESCALQLLDDLDASVVCPRCILKMWLTLWVRRRGAS